MRIVMAIVLGVAAGMLADSARAQNIFFDSFNGTRLRPHWQQPPPEHWEHAVGGGQLTVTDLFHPGVPGELNTASIEAEFPVFGTSVFTCNTLLGWAPGEGRRLTVRLWGPDGLEAAFGYDDSGPEPLVFLERPEHPTDPIQTAPAPGPGTHEFRLVDPDGDGFRLFVDGVPRLGFVAAGYGFSRLEVDFAGTEGLEFSSLQVGLVRLVPAPGAVLVVAGGIGITVASRRR